MEASADAATQTPIEPRNINIITVEPKQTLKMILKTKGLEEKKITKILKSLKTSVGEFTLSEGQEIYISFKDEGVLDIDTIKFRPVPECEVILKANDKDAYDVEKKSIELIKKLKFVSGKMTGSFYNSAKTSGLPAKLVKGVSVALGYVVNFQHDIKRGDDFQFLYEVFEDPNGKIEKFGHVLYVSLNAKGKNYSLYGYHTQNGKKVDYFTREGEGVVRGFLQTPLDGRRVRVTSGFTLKGRMHPIKGFCRAHKGVDFGASYGTAVLAAADGVVIQAGYDGDYGNKITLSHANGYKTVYAHLSKIKVKKGMCVKQRQVIGNVGSTGLSTGPHLHFETIARNVHVNPMSIKQMPTQKLSGDLLKRFRDHVFSIEKDLVKLNPPEITVVRNKDV